jgi:hypothetical protein
MPKIYFEEKYETLTDFIDKPTPVSKANMKWWNSITEQYNPEILGNGQEPSPYLKKHRAGGNARACPVITDALTQGYIMYSGIDVYFDATGEEILAQRPTDIPQDVAGESILYRNDPWQTNNILHTPEGFHPQTFKLDPMFGIRTDPGYSVLITHPFYRDDLPWKFMDAIIDTDKFAAYFHVSFWVKKGFKGTIKQGTPMFQVMPFLREDFEMVIQPYDEERVIRQYHGLSTTFIQGYKKHFWQRKTFK